MPDEWKEVSVEWVGESAFHGHNATGGCVQIGNIQDQPGLSPMELVLIGVAGCTGMDVISILHKKRQIIEKLEIQVRGKRAEMHPRVYTEIEVFYQFWGERIDPKMVESAIDLSEEKYCSVSAMLSAKSDIRSRYIINQPSEPVLPV